MKKETGKTSGPRFGVFGQGIVPARPNKTKKGD